ncbi:hypothetical protein C8R42DRAFT_659437 [Lentinula raphanica]|nr:hypothetical protein C8R42DRAFT_659437 [Lentinula raphanica]
MHKASNHTNCFSPQSWSPPHEITTNALFSFFKNVQRLFAFAIDCYYASDLLNRNSSPRATISSSVLSAPTPILTSSSSSISGALAPPPQSRDLTPEVAVLQRGVVHANFVSRNEADLGHEKYDNQIEKFVEDSNNDSVDLERRADSPSESNLPGSSGVNAPIELTTEQKEKFLRLLMKNHLNFQSLIDGPASVEISELQITKPEEYRAQRQQFIVNTQPELNRVYLFGTRAQRLQSRLQLSQNSEEDIQKDISLCELIYFKFDLEPPLPEHESEASLMESLRIEVDNVSVNTRQQVGSSSHNAGRTANAERSFRQLLVQDLNNLGSLLEGPASIELLLFSETDPQEYRARRQNFIRRHQPTVDKYYRRAIGARVLQPQLLFPDSTQEVVEGILSTCYAIYVKFDLKPPPTIRRGARAE